MHMSNSYRPPLCVDPNKRRKEKARRKRIIQAEICFISGSYTCHNAKYPQSLAPIILANNMKQSFSDCNCCNYITYLHLPRSHHLALLFSWEIHQTNIWKARGFEFFLAINCSNCSYLRRSFLYLYIIRRSIYNLFYCYHLLLGKLIFFIALDPQVIHNSRVQRSHQRSGKSRQKKPQPGHGFYHPLSWEMLCAFVCSLIKADCQERWDVEKGRENPRTGNDHLFANMYTIVTS